MSIASFYEHQTPFLLQYNKCTKPATLGSLGNIFNPVYQFYLIFESFTHGDVFVVATVNTSAVPYSSDMEGSLRREWYHKENLPNTGVWLFAITIQMHSFWCRIASHAAGVPLSLSNDPKVF